MRVAIPPISAWITYCLIGASMALSGSDEVPVDVRLRSGHVGSFPCLVPYVPIVDAVSWLAISSVLSDRVLVPARILEVPEKVVGQVQVVLTWWTILVRYAAKNREPML